MAEAVEGLPVSRRGFVLGAVACTLATLVCREASAEPAIAHLLGTFRFVGGAAERRALNRAVRAHQLSRPISYRLTYHR
jgi:hypothetical protein